MKEKTLGRKTGFQGRLLKLEVMTVELDGVRSTREVVRHPGATAVLAELPDGRFIFVKQYRKPVERELIEIVAGVKHRGEQPARCAVREVREETGYTVRRLTSLGSILPSPGYTDEELHLFHAMLNPRKGKRGLDEDERISLCYLTARQVERLLKTGRVRDGKTLAAWLLYRLRIRHGKT